MVGDTLSATLLGLRSGKWIPALTVAAPVALASGVILSKLGNSGVALVIGAITIVILIVLRQDELLAATIVLVSIMLDWYHVVSSSLLPFPILAPVLSLVLIAVMILSQSPERRWVPVPNFWLWGLLLILALPAIPRTVDLRDSVLYYGFGLLLTPLLTYIIGVQLGTSLGRVRRLFVLLSVLAALIAAHTITAALTGTFLLASSYQTSYELAHSNFDLLGSGLTRVGSFFGNPDFNGAFLAMMAFIPLSLMLDSRSRVAMALYAAELALILVALLFTYSAASWAALGVGLVVYLVLVGSRRYRVAISASMGVVVALALLIFPSQLDLLVRHAQTPGTLALREAIWRTAIRIIEANPVMGIGWGQLNYIARSTLYRVPEQPMLIAHPHDSYLEVAAMAGLPVLSLYLTLVGGVVWLAVRTYRQATIRALPLLGGGLSAIVVLSFNSVTINGWTLPPLAALAWLILGVLASPALARSSSGANAPPGDFLPFMRPEVGDTPTPESRQRSSSWEYEFMKSNAQRNADKFALPVIGFLIGEWRSWRKEQGQPCYRRTQMGQESSDPPPYPVDMSPLLALPHGTLDGHGVPFNVATVEYPAAYHPTTIAQFALASWNAYVATGAEKHRKALLTQAFWLLEHETRTASDMGVWPIPFPASRYPTPKAWISALTQGNIISVFARAYRLTGEEVFLRGARRAVRPFELDILDGGVSAPVGADGLFFEEVAVYPASRILNGYIFAVIGLYDYVALTDDSRITALIQRSHDTLHELMSEFDTGYWSRYDQLHQDLATPFYHAVHVALLEVLSQSSGCERCAAVAARWATHERRRSSRLRYLVASRGSRYVRGVGRRLRHALLRVSEVDGQTNPDLVCVPIAAFPVAGGTRSVLAGVGLAMAREWEMEYLTNHMGPHTEDLAICRFGHASAVPWRFPNVWLYVFSGWSRLLSLVRQGHHHRLILPQDGAFTGAFAGVVGKMLGVRVVCMDHGNVTLPYSPAYRAEREQASMGRRRPQRLLWRLRDLCYVPSLHLLTYIATRCADHFLPAGDDVAETYVRQYGVHPSRITRYPFLVDVARFTPIDDATRIERRAQYGVIADAIVVTMVNRLALEKGLDVALQGMREALQALPSEARTRVRMIIAGEGPLRAQVEAGMRRNGLDAVCTLLGEVTPDGVSQLLSVSDIFLYTGTRGINPVAVLEAMAAGCGVIATTAPHMVATYLAENRGIAIPPSDAHAVGTALSQAITDLPLCRQMGCRAREYVTAHHTAPALLRALRRGTFWAPNVEEMSSAAMPQAGTWRGSAAPSAAPSAALSPQQVAATGDYPRPER